MNALLQYLTTHPAAILEGLMRFELRVAFLALLVLGIDLVLRRATPRFRYALWLVALTGALWPPSLALSALDIWGRQPTIMETFAPVVLAPVAAEPGITINWATLALLLWGVMSASILILMTVNFVRFRLRLHPPHAQPWSYDEKVTATGQPWPPIWTTDRVHSPLTIGLLRPRIYLTWQAIRSGKAAVKAILYHELAHILRRDGWVSLLQAAALVIHPFNPLVWIMNARLSRYREQLCDDFALEHAGMVPRDYGNILLDQLSQGKLPLLAVQTPTYFFETKRDLVHRLQQLMKLKEGMMNIITSSQKVLLAGLAAGLLFIASQCQQEIEPISPALDQIDGTDQAAPGYPELGFTYTLAKSGPVRVVAYDQAGDEVFVLFDSHHEAGPLKVTWRGIKADGERVPLGVYFIRFEAPGDSRTFRATFGNAETSTTKTAPVSAPPTATTPAEADTEPVVRFIPYDEPPKPIGGYVVIQQHLVYPAEAKDAGIEGTVIVHAFIADDGKTSTVKIAKNETGDARLGEAAMEALRPVAWEPAKQKGTPVGVWISIPVNFMLSEDEK